MIDKIIINKNTIYMSITIIEGDHIVQRVVLLKKLNKKDVKQLHLMHNMSILHKIHRNQFFTCHHLFKKKGKLKEKKENNYFILFIRSFWEHLNNLFFYYFWKKWQIWFPFIWRFQGQIARKQGKYKGKWKLFEE